MPVDSPTPSIRVAPTQMEKINASLSNETFQEILKINWLVKFLFDFVYYDRNFRIDDSGYYTVSVSRKKSLWMIVKVNYFPRLIHFCFVCLSLSLFLSVRARVCNFYNFKTITLGIIARELLTQTIFPRNRFDLFFCTESSRRIFQIDVIDPL